jgi:hypothetical protein
LIPKCLDAHNQLICLKQDLMQVDATSTFANAVEYSDYLDLRKIEIRFLEVIWESP